MARILVVDDNPGMRLATRLLLEHAGHEVEQASDGLEACGLLGRRWFDLVVTDLRMPLRDGFDVLRHARAKRRAGPVILVTADHSVEVVRQAKRLGAYDVLSKPFCAHGLLALARAALGSSAPLYEADERAAS